MEPRVIESAGDLVGLGAQEEQSDRLRAMGQAGSDVLLLAARRNGNAGTAQDQNVADDGAQATVEQAEGEILVREEPALFAGLGGEAQQASAAEPDDAMMNAHLEVIVAGIEG